MTIPLFILKEIRLWCFVSKFQQASQHAANPFGTATESLILRSHHTPPEKWGSPSIDYIDHKAKILRRMVCLEQLFYVEANK